MAYYKYRITQEFDKSYGYEDPLFRKAVALSRYVKMLSGRELKDARIEKLGIENDKAAVELTLRVKVRLINQVAAVSQVVEHDTPVAENWIKVEGQWYHAFAAGEAIEKKGGIQ